ncbi:hypothetical protein NHP164001_08730 [Helicobacter trogontum]|uniref:Uncharacterized protein n=1 Tax=Helicobacter trogontum TaxID=50960 RepID=A0ABQ0D3E4_9HELI
MAGLNFNSAKFGYIIPLYYLDVGALTSIASLNNETTLNSQYQKPQKITKKRIKIIKLY